MHHDDEVIRKHSVHRLTKIFKVGEQTLVPGARFGHELAATSRSDFGRNEFDLVDDDIKDVSDNRTRKALAKGSLLIETVNDYCEHMIRCYRSRPDEVAHVLGLPRQR